MQRIHCENPPSFHMYNLAKLEACSEPCQIPQVDLFAIISFNGFNCFRKKVHCRCLAGFLIYHCKMLYITSIMFKRKVHSHLHTLHLDFGSGQVLVNCLSSNNEVVDLIYSGNLFHMFAPKTIQLLFSNIAVF